MIQMWFDWMVIAQITSSSCSAPHCSFYCRNPTFWALWSHQGNALSDSPQSKDAPVPLWAKYGWMDPSRAFLSADPCSFWMRTGTALPICSYDGCCASPWLFWTLSSLHGKTKASLFWWGSQGFSRWPETDEPQSFPGRGELPVWEIQR